MNNLCSRDSKQHRVDTVDPYILIRIRNYFSTAELHWRVGDFYVFESNQPSRPDNGEIYEIKIKGLLDDHWQQWFEGMTLKRQENVEGGQDYTLIIGPIADQPALHGLLAKIRDLNLTLLSFTKIVSTDPSNSEGAQVNE